MKMMGQSGLAFAALMASVGRSMAGGLDALVLPNTSGGLDGHMASIRSTTRPYAAHSNHSPGTRAKRAAKRRKWAGK